MKKKPSASASPSPCLKDCFLFIFGMHIFFRIVGEHQGSTFSV